jgi:hypothetical protein
LAGSVADSDFFIPIEVWPDVGAPCAARLTGKPQFKIGQPGHLSPLIAVEWLHL